MTHQTLKKEHQTPKRRKSDPIKNNRLQKNRPEKEHDTRTRTSHSKRTADHKKDVIRPLKRLSDTKKQEHQIIEKSIRPQKGEHQTKKKTIRSQKENFRPLKRISDPKKENIRPPKKL